MAYFTTWTLPRRTIRAERKLYAHAWIYKCHVDFAHVHIIIGHMVAFSFGWTKENYVSNKAKQVFWQR